MALHRWGSSIQKFGFINRVDNVIGHRTEILKADVLIKGADLEDEFLFQILAAFRRT